jgi:hypothetical protein
VSGFGEAGVTKLPDGDEGVLADQVIFVDRKLFEQVDGTIASGGQGECNSHLASNIGITIRGTLLKDGSGGSYRSGILWFSEGRREQQ